MDLFVVPTIGFDLLYAFVIVRLDRRDRPCPDQRHSKSDCRIGCTSDNAGISLRMRLRTTSSAIATGSMAASSRADCAPWASGTSLPPARREWSPFQSAPRTRATADLRLASGRVVSRPRSAEGLVLTLLTRPSLMQERGAEPVPVHHKRFREWGNAHIACASILAWFAMRRS
jgi:hypothetical protein